MTVKPVPDGYHTVTPYLVMRNAADAIEFYRKVFGAEVLLKMDAPGGKIGHAEVMIGDSPIMLADEYPDEGFVGPETIGGTPVTIMVYVDDADQVFGRAIELGATELKSLKDQFYGDRSGTLRDPFGHVWTIATHVEDVAEEDLERRMKEQYGS